MPDVTPDNPTFGTMPTEFLWKLASAPASVVITLLFGWQMLVAGPAERQEMQAVIAAQRKEFVETLANIETRGREGQRYTDEKCYSIVVANQKLLQDILAILQRMDSKK